MSEMVPNPLSFFFSISSKLCKVTRSTITPSIFVGSIFATGTITPVLPTCKDIELILLSFSKAGNL